MNWVIDKIIIRNEKIQEKKVQNCYTKVVNVNFNQKFRIVN
jgi:hypothetical protein